MTEENEELAPHIEEITKALNNKVDPHEIQMELETFVNDYGIKLPEAKRAIIKKHGGKPGVLSPTKTYKISQLKDGLFRVELSARVLSLSRRTFEKDGVERSMFSGVLADETGKIEFTAWDDYGLEEGKAYRFTNAYTRQWRGRTQINLGNSTQVTPIKDEDFAPLELLLNDVQMSIDKLTRIGGAPGVRVEGFFVSVRNGSGLIFRCPECNRVLQKGTCMIHGKVVGVPDLRIKGIVDDGYGALYLIANREATEDILGMGIEECQEVARERMDHSVIQEILAEKLVGKYVYVSGDVYTDDYGTNMIVRDMGFTEKDTAEEAKAILEEMGE